MKCIHEEEEEKGEILESTAIKLFKSEKGYIMFQNTEGLVEALVKCI